MQTTTNFFPKASVDHKPRLHDDREKLPRVELARLAPTVPTMMTKTAKTTAIYWLAAAFLVSFFTVGVPYWQIAYSKVSLPDTLYGAGLIVVGVLAAAARAFGKARLMAVIFVVGAAIPAAILARVAVETASDPTSHNLWPLEMIIAAVVGMVSSSAGALVGSLPSFFSKR